MPLNLINITSLRGYTEPTAAQKVFSTVELLEMILIYLPMTKLFVLQRINTTFHDTINGSIHLRRKMFLENDPSFEAANKHQINPILEKAAFEPRPGLYLEFITEKNCRTYRRPLKRHVEFDLPFFTKASSPASRLRDKIWFGHVPKTRKKLKLPHRLDVTESWQKMLLKQGKPARSSVRCWMKQGPKACPLDYARDKLERRARLDRVWEFIAEMN